MTEQTGVPDENYPPNAPRPTETETPRDRGYENLQKNQREALNGPDNEPVTDESSRATPNIAAKRPMQGAPD